MANRDCPGRTACDRQVVGRPHRVVDLAGPGAGRPNRYGSGQIDAVCVEDAAEVQHHEIVFAQLSLAGTRVRQRAVGSGGDDGVERRALEAGPAEPQVDGQRHVPFGSSALHFLDDARHDSRQHLRRRRGACRARTGLFAPGPARRSPRSRKSVGTLSPPRSAAMSQRVTGDGEMRRLEPDAGRRHRPQQRRQRRVVRSVDHHQLEVRACVRRLAHRLDRRHVAEVGDEVQAIGGQHDDGRAAGEIGEVQNVRQRGDDQRVERLLGARLSNGLVAAAKRCRLARVTWMASSHASSAASVRTVSSPFVASGCSQS